MLGCCFTVIVIVSSKNNGGKSKSVGAHGCLCGDLERMTSL